MSFLHKLEKISFKKLFTITFISFLVFAAPTLVWVSQQQTQLSSKAYFEKPQVIKPVKKYGAASSGNPQITLVWPFLGKAGDAVLIEGINFGDNPQNKKLRIGNVLVPEDLINTWVDNLIEFIIPPQTISGLVNLEINGNKTSWPYLFTIYDLDTNIQVTENNDIVKVLNIAPGSKIEIYFADGSKMESDKLDGVVVPSNKTIISIVVKNNQGYPLKFYVDPEEFGF